ncbi:hypothetical protein HJG60_009663 [Phyllostomus discolor]|uniref:Uncharacterized protein n=1 Tax=Phyllostomus discolor TaxID=89673 RepID=A0A834B6H6_9CHIR|nr:hypothetical protein HJG60_009663 [Phyllostomus discolor]
MQGDGCFHPTSPPRQHRLWLGCAEKREEPGCALTLTWAPLRACMHVGARPSPAVGWLVPGCMASREACASPETRRLTPPCCLGPPVLQAGPDCRRTGASSEPALCPCGGTKVAGHGGGAGRPVSAPSPHAPARGGRGRVALVTRG